MFTLPEPLPNPAAPVPLGGFFTAGMGSVALHHFGGSNFVSLAQLRHEAEGGEHEPLQL